MGAAGGRGYAVTSVIRLSASSISWQSYISLKRLEKWRRRTDEKGVNAEGPNERVTGDKDRTRGGREVKKKKKKKAKRKATEKE